MGTARQTIFISWSDNRRPMFAQTTPPLVFCVTGFGWLVLTSIVGMATLVGLVHGTPLPSWIRALHVHAALVGGVGQILLGGLLLFIPPSNSANRKEADSHPLTFWAMNSGLIGMLLGFWLHRDMLVDLAGFVVITAFLFLIYTVWVRASRTRKLSAKDSWYYALSLFCLVGGSACGEIMTLGYLPNSHGYVRLAHIHLGVIGFVVLAIIGVVHHLLPALWNSPLMNGSLARTGFVLMPTSVAILIGGFLNSSVPLELAAGAILFIGVILWTAGLLRTWLSSTSTGGAARPSLRQHLLPHLYRHPRLAGRSKQSLQPTGVTLWQTSPRGLYAHDVRRLHHECRHGNILLHGSNHARDQSRFESENSGGLS